MESTRRIPTHENERTHIMHEYEVSRVVPGPGLQTPTTSAPVPERQRTETTQHPLRPLSMNRMTQAAMTAPQPKVNYVESPLSPEDHESLSKHISKFLDIYEKLEPVNHPDVKPNYSYTELLMMAILRSQNYCRPITEVYSYIKDKYLFYKHTKKGFWKNAIRHSLSKTKCFTKVGVGRGMRSGVLNRPVYLWTLVPECLVKFAKGDYRVSLDSNGANNLKCAFTQVNAEAFWSNVAKTLGRVMEAIRESLTPETDAYVSENVPQKREPEEHTGCIGNLSPEQTMQPKKRVKLEQDEYTPNGNIRDVTSGTFAYSPAATYPQYEARPFTNIYGNAVQSYGYDFASTIPDIATNYGNTQTNYFSPPPAVHPAFMHSSPYGCTTLRSREEAPHKVTITSPSQRSTSPNSSIDVTGVGNSSFSDSFRSVDNEDRKPYVEVETTDFGGEFIGSVPKFETQQTGSNEIIDFLAQNGLIGFYQYQ